MMDTSGEASPTRVASPPRDPVIRYVCPRDNYVATVRGTFRCPRCGREMR